VATVAGFADDGAWGVWALAAALVGLGVVGFRRLSDRIRTADRLLDELQVR
jgi:hypothetical protein